MVVRELFVRLGLKTEAASFAEGYATVELLKKGLEIVKEKAQEAKEWIKEQISATAEAGEEAAHTAQRVGLQAQQLQRLAYVGNLSGVSMEQLAHGLQHLARTGVSDVQGRFMQLADQFARMPDSGRKTAMAMHYFGREGAAVLIPTLNKGTTAIRELMNEADAMGAVMSKEDLEATEEYSRSIRRLEASGRGLRNTVVVPLLGLLSRLANLVTRGVIGFREWYKATILTAGGMRNLVFWLKTLGETLLTLAGIWAINAGAIGAATLAVLHFNLYNISAAAEAVVAWLAAAAPWILIAAGIALVILWLQDFYTFLNGGDSVIGRMVKTWKTQFGSWGDFMHDLWTTIKYEAGELWDWLGNEIKKIPGVDFLIKAVTGIPTSTGSAYAGAFGGGATSPSAAATQAALVSNSSSTSATYAAHTHVTVNVAGDGDAHKIKKHVSEALADHHTRIMREARAAAP